MHRPDLSDDLTGTLIEPADLIRISLRMPERRAELRPAAATEKATEIINEALVTRAVLAAMMTASFKEKETLKELA